MNLPSKTIFWLEYLARNRHFRVLWGSRSGKNTRLKCCFRTSVDIKSGLFLFAEAQREFARGIPHPGRVQHSISATPRTNIRWQGIGCQGDRPSYSFRRWEWHGRTDLKRAFRNKFIIGIRLGLMGHDFHCPPGSPDTRSSPTVKSHAHANLRAIVLHVSKFELIHVIQSRHVKSALIS